MSTTTSKISKRIAITSKVTITNNPSIGKPYSFIIASGMSGDAFASFKAKYKNQIEAAIVELQFEDEIRVEAMELPSEKVIITDDSKKFMLCFKYKDSKWVFALPVRFPYFQSINVALAMYCQNMIDDIKSGNQCEYKIAMFYPVLSSNN
jgi:hypothetical protein